MENDFTVGGLIGLLVIGAVAYYLYNKRKNKDE